MDQDRRNRVNAIPIEHYAQDVPPVIPQADIDDFARKLERHLTLSDTERVPSRPVVPLATRQWKPVRKLANAKIPTPFELLPPQFNRKFQEQRATYLASEALWNPLRTSKTSTDQTVLWFMHAAGHAGMNFYSEEPFDDYVIVTFNFLTMNELDDVAQQPSWDEKLNLSSAEFNNIMRDNLRVHLVLIPADVNDIRYFNKKRLNKEQIFVHGDRNGVLARFFAAFYSLI
jgi:hypothetical protein